MNRILGNFRSGAARVALVACVATATVAALAIPASANTGTVHTAQDCYTWSASVSLDTNVTPAHDVEVTTTIPGTTGLTGNFDTTGNTGPQQIWSVHGTAPSHGTVTLTIWNPGHKTIDTQTSASLPPSEVCPTTTTLPPNVVTTTTAPPAVVTTTTVAPTTTITVSPTSITLPPTTPPTAPPSTPPTTPSTPSAPTTPTSTHQQVIPGSSTTTTSITPGGQSQSLPFTGSGTAFPAIFGLSCLAGGAVLAVRRRGRWAIRK